MSTVEQLEARLAELEIRLGIGVTPLAANPPITIGELTDVPAPGSPIASPWAQEVSNRIIHRFANKAALDAWAAANGSYAVTLDSNVLYVRRAGVWEYTTPRLIGYTIGTPASVTGGPVDLSTQQVAFTAVAGHRYHVRGTWNVNQTVASAVVNLYVTDAGNSNLNGVTPPGVSIPVGTYGLLAVEAWFTPAAGAFTCKLRGFASAGTAVSANPSVMAVTDWGPP
jgi:hypothetical protein